MAALATLADVKQYLNIDANDDTDDAELSGTLAAAISAIEKVIGPINPQPFTEVVDSHGWKIPLAHTPVLSVESVLIQPWLGATPIDDTAAWLVNAETGVLRRVLTGGSMPFFGAGSVFTITYTAGRDATNVDPDLNEAIKRQVDRMWQSQRGAMPIQASEEPPPPSYPGAYGFLGADVMELLNPDLVPPGIA